MSLERLLNTTIKRNPQRYKEDIIERVRRLVRFETENRQKRKPYRFLEEADDFVLYYELHPGWHGKSTKEMHDDSNTGSGAFYSSFRKCLIRTIDDVVERKRISKVLFKQRRSWIAFTNIDDWRSEYLSHQEWQRMSHTELRYDTEFGGCAFFLAFNKWVNQQTIDVERRKELRQQVFGPQYAEYKWISFQTLGDWKAEYENHPEWHGKSPTEIENDVESEGRVFFHAFSKWVRRWARENSKSKRERKLLVSALFEHKDNIRAYTTLEEWRAEYEKHPEWHGKSTSEMRSGDDPDGRKFYSAFSMWTHNNLKTEAEKKACIRSIFPDRKAPFRYDFGYGEVYFDSYPERIIGILLNKYGLIQTFVEGVNLHVRTNGRKGHSIDFLTDHSFLEFHPLGIRDRRKGLTLEEAHERKRSSITNSQYRDYRCFCISTIGGLYDLLQDDGVQKHMHRRYRALERDQFTRDVSEAFELSVRYDASVKR